MTNRLKQIEQYISENAGCTQREIADGIGLRKTPYLAAMLRKLVRRKKIMYWVDSEVFPPRFRYAPQDTQEMWE